MELGARGVEGQEVHCRAPRQNQQGEFGQEALRRGISQQWQGEEGQEAWKIQKEADTTAKFCIVGIKYSSAFLF